jgi:PAS domain-containing protein
LFTFPYRLPFMQSYFTQDTLESESKQQLKYLADALPQLVWIARSNGEVIYYNDRVQEYAGA